MNLLIWCSRAFTARVYNYGAWSLHDSKFLASFAIYQVATALL